MLDHLKQQSQAGVAARERARLAIIVGALVLAGGAIVVSTSLSQNDEERDAAQNQAAPNDAAITPGAVTPQEQAEPFEAHVLRERLAQDDAQPHRWALRAFEYLESIRRYGHFPPAFTPVIASAVRNDAQDRFGGTLQLEGRVVDRAQEDYTPPGVDLENAVLWSLVVEDPRGGTFVVVTRGDAQGTHGGAPMALAPGHASRPIQAGDTILARGVYLQDRLGTIGETVLREATPVLYSVAIRRDVPPDERAEPIPDPSEGDWEEVHDLTLAETQRWDEDVLYQLIQYARAQGADSLRKAIDDGAIPWKEWDRDTFEQVWKKEVDPEDGQPRTFTEGSRGKLFRLDGVVADYSITGWDVVPPNRWRVQDFGLLTLLADDYRQVAVRFFNPFGKTDFPKVAFKRRDLVRVYGLFVKNHTYRTRYKDPATGEYRFLTVPLFVLLRADPHPGASDSMVTAMYWVAGAIVVLTLLFYFVLVRGGRKQDASMEAQKLRLRKKRRLVQEPSAE